MIRALALAFGLAALPALAAEEIVSGLSQNRVAITANFDGSEILIYGAVKRDAPAPDDKGRMEVIVTVEGPATPLVIRRKEKIAGIWLNRDAVTIDKAPSFYAVATTGPLEEILSGTEDLRHSITLPQVIRAVGISAEASDPQDFVESLQRIRLAEDRYRVAEGSVQFLEETLFRADVVLPANLTEGNYNVRIFLTRNGLVVDNSAAIIGVRKTGLERFLFRMAHDQPALYGAAALLLAAFAGWLASFVFRFIRS
jgi:uncharacterized protein (TIGR02186 family)